MNEIPLEGCTATPLAGYLKGLGISRTLSSRDSRLRIFWRNDHLMILTQLNQEEIVSFFLQEYAPTPIVAPWNGGSGFFEKDKKDALQAIFSSQTDRLRAYRLTLKAAETALEGFDRTGSPKGENKHRLLTRARALFPEEALAWFDAAVVLTGENAKYPPLLGTGGNDGRLDFTNNFMQRITNLMDPKNGNPTEESKVWLKTALFATPNPGLLKGAIGQFSPGQAGGPNSTVGFGDKGRMNPWDFVLMIEGALVFASATVRRHSSHGEGSSSFPFTVRATAAGAGHLGSEDAGDSRGELWMPLWSGPASFTEIQALFSEGRVALGRRPTHDGLDFIRAVHRLGAYRGIDAFQRYGLLKRSGMAYLAAPIQRIQVQIRSQSNWIDELDIDGWLSRFQRYARGDKTPRRFIVLRRRLDEALFTLLSSTQGPISVQKVLILLAEIQSAVGKSPRAAEKIPPVPLLSGRWASGADDGSTEYRIALALASVGTSGRKMLPMRSHLFPVHPGRHGWTDMVCKEKHGEDPSCRHNLTVPLLGALPQFLTRIVERRMLLQGAFQLEENLLSASIGLDLGDVGTFLHDGAMDHRVRDLLPALSLCKEFKKSSSSPNKGQVVPASYGLLALTLASTSILHKLAGLQEGRLVLPPRSVIVQLGSNDRGKARVAIQGVWGRLRNCGLTPIMPSTQCPQPIGLVPTRLSAAALLPLDFKATAKLVRSLLHPPEVEEAP